MAYDQLFEQAGRQFNVDPALLRAQMLVESNGNPNAKSEKDAMGLMQLIPSTQKALGVTNPNDPKQSIFAAAELMAENLDRYGNVADAVKAYHGGTDQANWGPKTNAYVSKVLAGYGNASQTQAAPQAATAEPGDDLAADFMMPKAQAAAPEDDLLSDFASPSAATAAKSAQTGVSEGIPATSPQAQQAQPGGGLIDTATGLVQSLGAQGISNANAVGRGISDALDAPAEWLAAGAEKSGLTGLLAKGGINMPTEAQQIQINKDSRAQYDAANPAPGIQGMASRVGGNILATAAPIAKAGQVIGAGGNALMSAIRATPAVAGAAPALSATGNFLAGNGGMLSRMANLGTQGAAGAALLSGASDTPLAEQMGVGAALGAAVPVGAALLKGGVNVGQALVRPFTQGGRQNIANKVVGDEAALGGGIPENIVPQVAPGQTPFPKVSAPYAAPGQPSAQSTPGPTGVPGAPPPAAAPALAASVNDLLGKASVGGRLAANFNEIIPGSRPTLAQATGNGGIATFERGMAQRSTEAANAFNELQQANNAARMNFFNGIRGDADTLAQAIAKREETAIPMLDEALAGARPANANPIISQIDSILASPDGKRKSVVSAMGQVKQNLQDAGGNLETDVRQLYGVRKAINDQLEKVAGKDNSEAQQASSQLLQVKKSLDAAIEQAAPGFKGYLANYAELSKPITSQSYLQNLDLTDQTSSAFTLQKLKAQLLKIERARKAPGASEAKDLSPEQMDGMYRLQADLQREANSALGRVKGSSDTNQLLRQNNLLDVMLGGVGGKAVSAAPASIGTGVGYLIGGPGGAALGGMIGQNVGSGMGRAISAKAPEVEANLLQMLTNPNPEMLNALKGASTNSLLNKVLNKGAPAIFNGGANNR